MSFGIILGKSDCTSLGISNGILDGTLVGTSLGIILGKSDDTSLGISEKT